MLALTEDAAHTIEQLLDDPQVPVDGGIRIAGGAPSQNGNGGDPQLRVTVEPQPVPEDVVLESEGARVFIEPTVAPFLDDKVLDVTLDGTRMQFSVHHMAA